MKLDKDNFIFTTRIDLPDGGYIVLREPTDGEIKGFSGDAKEDADKLRKIFPGCIVEHNYDDVMTREVAEALGNSGSLFADILTKWMQSIPFQNRIAGKSDK